ncbi:hypothetical protein JIN84_09810 [Luteolibacter yonseiensis]|uniref:Uncharacterized protein n=1 Tax=Luteolibacter yonseiensis TaxID=1144680 RepID=A0A934R693_9BACT|nr:hypothetical protein [Luteolibacter yonseiensis]MBK1815914.1 hypothetical protein [Luteolibacter yonseiensis]
MNEPSPYLPPLPEESSHNPYAYAGEPTVVKVFGILHLVFAGLGILGGLWGLFATLFADRLMKLLPSSPELDQQIQAQAAMQEKFHVTSLASSTLTLLVAVPMIIAGIQLLKHRKTALKWSNIYAFSSITTKALNLAITLLFVFPAMRQMTSGLGSSPMTATMTGGAVGSMLALSAYPVLTLILLNRPPVKAWFKQLPDR